MQFLCKAIVVYAITAFWLSGCVTRDPEAIGPYPNGFREIVARHIKENFFDPYSLRDVSITYPQEGHMGFKQGWIVCLEANAKNRFGGYIGLKRTAYLINRGKVVSSVDEAPLCDEMTFVPWTDMEVK